MIPLAKGSMLWFFVLQHTGLTVSVMKGKNKEESHTLSA